MPPALLASSNFTDPEHERLIWLAAGGLVLLGVLLTIATVMWWRGTKGEHAALAPLEVMGDLSFPTLTHVEQSRRLDAVRLQLEGDVEPAAVAPDEAVDLDEVLRAFQPGFDDLRDERSAVGAASPAPANEGGVPTPAAVAAVPRIAVQVVGATAEPDTPDTPDAVSSEAPAPAAVTGETSVQTTDDQVSGDAAVSAPEIAAADASDGPVGPPDEPVAAPASPVVHDQDEPDPPAKEPSDDAPSTNRPERPLVANGTEARRASGSDDLHSIDPLLAGEPVDS